MYGSLGRLYIRKLVKLVLTGKKLNILILVPFLKSCVFLFNCLLVSLPLIGLLLYIIHTAPLRRFLNGVEGLPSGWGKTLILKLCREKYIFDYWIYSLKPRIRASNRALALIFWYAWKAYVPAYIRAYSKIIASIHVNFVTFLQWTLIIYLISTPYIIPLCVVFISFRVAIHHFRAGGRSLSPKSILLRVIVYAIPLLLSTALRVRTDPVYWLIILNLVIMVIFWFL